MNKATAREIAETISNQQLSDMFNEAKSKIVDWTARGRVNKLMSKGTAWNILAANFDVNYKYNILAVTNMIWEFGDFLPNELIPKRKHKKYPKPHHQEPNFSK